MTARRRTQSWGIRLYGLLLHLAYPGPFRARFASAMRETFAAEYAAARERGGLTAGLLLARTVLDAFWFGAHERIGWATSARHTASHQGEYVVGHADQEVGPSGSRALAYLRAARTDVRYATRLLARNPVFTLTSVLSLAVGVAASTTIFGIADALFLQAGPGVRGGASLVDVARSVNNNGGDGPLTRPVVEALRTHSRTLEAMAVATRNPVPLSVMDRHDSHRAHGRPVSGNYFDVLQVRPAMGRFFRADEDQRAEPRAVAVLSHDYWRVVFGSDPGVLTRPVRVNGIIFDIVGVAEPAFQGTTIIGADLWVPLAIAGALRGDDSPTAATADEGWPWDDTRGIGRLNAGASREAARAELNAIFAGLRAENPSIPTSHGVSVDRSGRLPPRARTNFATFVALISALAIGLLAVACTNVAGMLLARATTRRHEMATRLSLGASRGRLLRQMLIETLVLFAVASAVALPLVWWTTHVLHLMLPTNLILPIRFDVSLSLRTVLFSVAISFVTGALFGLAPARHALQSDLSQMFNGRSAADGRERMRLRHTLVVTQVGLSLAMIITAGLLVRTLHAAANVDLGFRTADVIVATIDTSVIDVRGADAVALVDRLAERLSAIGGVTSVGHGRIVPLEGNRLNLGQIRVSETHQPGTGPVPAADWEVVSPTYFETIGLPLAVGRAFTAADRDGQPTVAIVNEAFARAAWPNESALGKPLWHVGDTPGSDRVLQVVGVARDGRYRYVSEPARPMVYLPFAQMPQTRVELYVAHAPGQAIAMDVRQTIAHVDPRLPVILLRSFDEATAVGLLGQRFTAWVAGTVGSIGALLAALGLYGVVAFLVAQRTREIAIRMALGATQAAVRTMVLRQAARLGVFGALLGVVLALGLARLVQHLGLLVGVSPSDPPTFVSVAIGMGLVLLAASYLPARRAASTDPAAALRAQ